MLDAPCDSRPHMPDEYGGVKLIYLAGPAKRQHKVDEGARGAGQATWGVLVSFSSRLESARGVCVAQIMAFM